LVSLVPNYDAGTSDLHAVFVNLQSITWYENQQPRDMICNYSWTRFARSLSHAQIA
jgi:hypothetical protein